MDRPLFEQIYKRDHRIFLPEDLDTAWQNYLKTYNCYLFLDSVRDVLINSFAYLSFPTLLRHLQEDKGRYPKEVLVKAARISFEKTPKSISNVLLRSDGDSFNSFLIDNWLPTPLLYFASILGIQYIEDLRYYYGNNMIGVTYKKDNWKLASRKDSKSTICLYTVENVFYLTSQQLPSDIDRKKYKRVTHPNLVFLSLDVCIINETIMYLPSKDDIERIEEKNRQSDNIAKTNSSTMPVLTTFSIPSNIRTSLCSFSSITMDGHTCTKGEPPKETDSQLPSVLSLDTEYDRNKNTKTDEKDQQNKGKKEVYMVSDPQERVCVICMERVKNIVLLPCKHLCLCAKCCTKEIKKCPICTQDVTGNLMIYDS